MIYFSPARCYVAMATHLRRLVMLVGHIRRKILFEMPAAGRSILNHGTLTGLMGCDSRGY